MAQSKSPTFYPGSFGRMYFVGWSIAAAIAVVYLAVLAVRPELIAAHTIGRPHDLESNEGARFLARNGDAPSVQTVQGQLQADVESLRLALASGEAREQALLSRLAALEIRVNEAATATVAQAASGEPQVRLVTSQPADPPSLIEGRVMERTAPTAAPVGPTAVVPNQPLPPPPSAKPKLAAAPAPAQAMPAAASAPPPSPPSPAPAQPGAAVASAEPGRIYGVALASGPSLEALRVSWALLSERHKAALQDLDARYTIQAEQAAPFQLIAGPFASAARAQQVCAVLQARRATCKISDFGGNAL